MCSTCGCAITPAGHHHRSDEAGFHHHGHVHAEVVLHDLLEHNDLHARENRSRLDRHGVLTINLMSSPGSGKTSLLEATIRALQGSLRIGVIEGDLETENDADRIRALGVPAYQITTGTACHLDAHLVDAALDHIDLSGLDLLFIENVGNLVCPASFDLGQHRNVVLLSVTEGDDKPAKYPVMFRAADLMLLSKSDLLRYLDDFSPERAISNLRQLASTAPAHAVSARSGEGMVDWLSWLTSQRDEHWRLLHEGRLMLPQASVDVRPARPVAPVVVTPEIVTVGC